MTIDIEELKRLLKEGPTPASDGVTDDSAALQWYADRGLPLPIKEGKVYAISKPIIYRASAFGLSEFSSDNTQALQDAIDCAAQPFNYIIVETPEK